MLHMVILHMGCPYHIRSTPGIFLYYC